MSAESVAELYGLLGIKTDARSVALATQALAKLKADTDKATQTAHLSAALKHVHGDATKAADLIGLSYKEADLKGQQATSRAERWGRAMLAINQTLEVGLKLYRGVQAGIRAVAGAVQAVSDQASQAVDLGKELGIDAEGVQELGYAASQSSSNLEQLSTGLGKLSKNVSAAKLGGKQAAQALREAGIDIKDVTSGHEKLDGALETIADRFAKMPDGAKKSALAMRLFGLSGRAMIPLLNEGSAGIKKLRQEAEDTGYVIDNKAAAALENFGDDSDKLKATLTGLRNQAIAALVPVLSNMVNGIQRWVQANRQLLVGALTGALRAFLGVLRVVGDVVEGVVATFGFLADHSDFLIAALSGVAGVLGILAVAWLVESAAAIAAAVASAAAWIAVLAPILLVAAGIGLLVYAILKLRKHFGAVIGAIVGFFKALWDGIKSGASSAWSALTAIGSAIGGFFAGIASTIREVFEDVVNWFIHRINEVIWVVNKMITALNYLPGVDIGHIGKIGDVGGKKKGLVSTTVSTATIPAPVRGAGAVDNSVVNQTNHTVINAQGMDEAKLAKAIADQAADKARSVKKLKGK
jgi:hypothetical protein